MPLLQSEGSLTGELKIARSFCRVEPHCHSQLANALFLNPHVVEQPDRLNSAMIL